MAATKIPKAAAPYSAFLWLLASELAVVEDAGAEDKVEEPFAPAAADEVEEPVAIAAAELVVVNSLGLLAEEGVSTVLVDVSAEEVVVILSTSVVPATEVATAVETREVEVLRTAPPGASAIASRVGDTSVAASIQVPSNRPTFPGPQQKNPSA
jgi:hypothetical protein